MRVSIILSLFLMVSCGSNEEKKAVVTSYDQPRATGSYTLPKSNNTTTTIKTGDTTGVIELNGYINGPELFAFNQDIRSLLQPELNHQDSIVRDNLGAVTPLASNSNGILRGLFFRGLMKSVVFDTQTGRFTPNPGAASENYFFLRVYHDNVGREVQGRTEKMFPIDLIYGTKYRAASEIVDISGNTGVGFLMLDKNLDTAIAIYADFRNPDFVARLQQGVFSGGVHLYNKQSKQYKFMGQFAVTLCDFFTCTQGAQIPNP